MFSLDQGISKSCSSLRTARMITLVKPPGDEPKPCLPGKDILFMEWECRLTLRNSANNYALNLFSYHIIEGDTPSTSCCNMKTDAHVLIIIIFTQPRVALPHRHIRMCVTRVSYPVRLLGSPGWESSIHHWSTLSGVTPAIGMDHVAGGWTCMHCRAVKPIPMMNRPLMLPRVVSRAGSDGGRYSILLVVSPMMVH